MALRVSVLGDRHVEVSRFWEEVGEYDLLVYLHLQTVEELRLDDMMHFKIVCVFVDFFKDISEM